MKKVASNLFLLVLIILSLQVGCERRAERNVAQSGQLVGTWQYMAPLPYFAYQVVAGDHSWWIQEKTEFRPDGTLNSSPPQKCHYWIESDTHFKLDCSAGQTRLPYRIEGSALTIQIGTWKEEKPIQLDVVFKRID